MIFILKKNLDLFMTLFDWRNWVWSTHFFSQNSSIIRTFKLGYLFFFTHDCTIIRWFILRIFFITAVLILISSTILINYPVTRFFLWGHLNWILYRIFWASGPIVFWKKPLTFLQPSSLTLTYFLNLNLIYILDQFYLMLYDLIMIFVKFCALSFINTSKVYHLLNFFCIW